MGNETTDKNNITFGEMREGNLNDLLHELENWPNDWFDSALIRNTAHHDTLNAILKRMNIIPTRHTAFEQREDGGLWICADISQDPPEWKRVT